MSRSELHERIEAAVGGRTFRAIAELTGQHPETVRRYMRGQDPSVEFLSALCTSLSLNAHWLMTGEGPMRADDVRGHALDQANPTELLTAVAAALERLTERVDRIESFVQTLETRLRVRVASDASESVLGGRSRGEKQPGDDEASRRARSVANALAERSRPDAD